MRCFAAPAFPPTASTERTIMLWVQHPPIPPSQPLATPTQWRWEITHSQLEVWGWHSPPCGRQNCHCREHNRVFKKDGWFVFRAPFCVSSRVTEREWTRGSEERAGGREGGGQEGNRGREGNRVGGRECVRESERERERGSNAMQQSAVTDQAFIWARHCCCSGKDVAATELSAVCHSVHPSTAQVDVKRVVEPGTDRKLAKPLKCHQQCDFGNTRFIF